MTDHDELIRNLAKLNTAVAEALTVAESLAPTPPQDGAALRAVFNSLDGFREDIMRWAEAHPEGPAPTTPPRPPSTDEYDVGEYARPEQGKHEGWWCGYNKKALWFNEGYNLVTKDVDPQHGYRWCISRKAPRHLQKLPDDPPDYEGKAMRWVRDEKGEVVWRKAVTGEYWYLVAYAKVVYRKEGFPTGDDQPICEPRPVVQGWDGEWLKVAIDRQTNRVSQVWTSPNEHATRMGEGGPGILGEIITSIPAKDFPVPPIPLPENSDEC